MAAAATVAVRRNLCCRGSNTNEIRCDAKAATAELHDDGHCTRTPTPLPVTMYELYEQIHVWQ